MFTSVSYHKTELCHHPLGQCKEHGSLLGSPPGPPDHRTLFSPLRASSPTFIGLLLLLVSENKCKCGYSAPARQAPDPACLCPGRGLATQFPDLGSGCSLTQQRVSKTAAGAPGRRRPALRLPCDAHGCSQLLPRSPVLCHWATRARGCQLRWVLRGHILPLWLCPGLAGGVRGWSEVGAEWQ